MEKYTFKTDNPEVLDFFGRILSENFEQDNKEVILVTSNYLDEAYIFTTEDFLKNFDKKDKVKVGGNIFYPPFWGTPYNIKYRFAAINKQKIKQTQQEIEKALAFKRKVKVAVFTF